MRQAIQREVPLCIYSVVRRLCGDYPRTNVAATVGTRTSARGAVVCQRAAKLTETSTKALNDVDIGKVTSLAEKISQEPHVADTTWRAEIKWNGGFRSEAKVREFDPVKSDEPDGIGGTNTGPNPVEQLLGALGNCLAVGYAANATAAGIAINDMTIEVEGNLDLHTFLGLKDGNAGFRDIKVSVNIDSDASPEALQALHEKVVGTSPVGHTLNRAVPIDIRLA